jgi:hypothetical protein
MPPQDDSPPVRRFVRVFDAPDVGPTDPDDDSDDDQDLPEPAPHHLSDPSAGEERLGSDRLNRLRGQYAAVLARISSRVREPDLADRLRALAERANPDAWVTKADVEAGLAGLDGVYAELARYVGRRRRRRRRTRGTRPGAPETPGADIGSVDDLSGGGPADVPEAEDDGDDEPTL